MLVHFGYILYFPFPALWVHGSKVILIEGRGSPDKALGISGSPTATPPATSSLHSSPVILQGLLLQVCEVAGLISA